MHLASGDVPVSRGVLPEGVAGVDATVRKVVEIAHSKWGAKSPKIRALAINIINAAKVANKDYYGMIKAPTTTDAQLLTVPKSDGEPKGATPYDGPPRPTIELQK